MNFAFIYRNCSFRIHRIILKTCNIERCGLHSIPSKIITNLINKKSHVLNNKLQNHLTIIFFGFSTIVLNVIVNVIVWMNQSLQMDCVISLKKVKIIVRTHTHTNHTHCFKVAICSKRTFNLNVLSIISWLIHQSFVVLFWNSSSIYGSTRTFSISNGSQVYISSFWSFESNSNEIVFRQTINTDPFLKNIMSHFIDSSFFISFLFFFHKHYYYVKLIITIFDETFFDFEKIFTDRFERRSTVVQTWYVI